MSSFIFGFEQSKKTFEERELKGECEMTEFEYYWEKAEFQDPVSHKMHVENYKKGIRDSIAFDEQYQKEAEEEIRGVKEL